MKKVYVRRGLHKTPQLSYLFIKAAFFLILLSTVPVTAPPKVQAQVSVSVWTDKSVYSVGETVKIFFTVSVECSVRLTVTKPDRTQVTIGPEIVGAGSHWIAAGSAGYPLGQREVLLEAWLEHEEYRTSAATYFEVVAPLRFDLPVVAGCITPPAGPIVGVPINYSVWDRGGLLYQGGTNNPTPFIIRVAQGDRVEVGAPQLHGQYNFTRWMEDGSPPTYPRYPQSLVTSFFVDQSIGPFSVEAQYITPAFNFTLSATPLSQTVNQGQSTTYTINVTLTSGSPTTVSLSLLGIPSTPFHNFNPPSGNPNRTFLSTLTVITLPNTPIGNYTLNVTAAGGGKNYTAQATLTVTAAPDLNIAVSPAFQVVLQKQTVTYTVAITPLGGFNTPVNLDLTGLPGDAGYSFSPNPVTSPTWTSLLTINAGTTTGTFTLTILSTGGGLAHTTTAMLTITAAPDFNIAVSPASQVILEKKIVTYTVIITPLGGFNAPVNLDLIGLPADAGHSFNPNPSLPGVSTSTINTGTATGTFTLTVLSTGGGLAHTTTAMLTIAVDPDRQASEDATEKAVDAISKAEDKGRTEGLDDAKEKLREAEEAHKAGNYARARSLADEARRIAERATKPFTEAYAPYIGIAVAFIAAATGFALIRKRKAPPTAIKKRREAG